MKIKAFFWMFLLGIFTLIGCQNKKNDSGKTAAEPTVVSENIRFCESTYPYDGGMLIANFGAEKLNPLNTEGKGYIVLYKDGKTNVLIPADGNLSAPKGMFVKDKYLFICDVNKIVVYNLNAPGETPQTISLPEGDLFVNDLAASNNTLYAAVTNTGRIYSMDITNPAVMAQATPVKWLDIVGPNGLLIENGVMYVASYPADGQTTDANVIYQIEDLANPLPQKFITTPGQYDGIALSADKKTMYITNWTPASVSAIDMETRQITPVVVEEELAGPADITVVNGEMYIPDLPNSRMICIPVN